MGKALRALIWIEPARNFGNVSDGHTSAGSHRRGANLQACRRYPIIAEYLFDATVPESEIVRSVLLVAFTALFAGGIEGAKASICKANDAFVFAE